MRSPARAVRLSAVRKLLTSFRPAGDGQGAERRLRGQLPITSPSPFGIRGRVRPCRPERPRAGREEFPALANMASRIIVAMTGGFHLKPASQQPDGHKRRRARPSGAARAVGRTRRSLHRLKKGEGNSANLHERVLELPGSELCWTFSWIAIAWDCRRCPASATLLAVRSPRLSHDRSAILRRVASSARETTPCLGDAVIE
jgi:hypothetical protein